jgi:ATP-dependent protease ClpP protease subunit
MSNGADAPAQEKEVYIQFTAPINIGSAQNLVGTIAQYIAQGFTKVVLLISTPGGIVDSGVTLYNTLRSLPIKIVTYNMGAVDSIGNVVFLAGEERYASVNSRFMFHGVGFQVQSMMLEEKFLEEKLRNIKSDHARIAGILEERTNLTHKQVLRYFHDAHFLTSDQAREHGMIQEISDVKIPLGAPFIQIAS